MVAMKMEAIKANSDINLPNIVGLTKRNIPDTTIIPRPNIIKATNQSIIASAISFSKTSYKKDFIAILFIS
jgi:hypothetical protein